MPLTMHMTHPRVSLSMSVVSIVPWVSQVDGVRGFQVVDNRGSLARTLMMAYTI